MLLRSWTRFLDWFRQVQRALFAKVCGRRSGLALTESTSGPRKTSTKWKKHASAGRASTLLRRLRGVETLEDRCMMSVTPCYDPNSHTLAIRSDSYSGEQV